MDSSQLTASHGLCAGCLFHDFPYQTEPGIWTDCCPCDYYYAQRRAFSSVFASQDLGLDMRERVLNSRGCLVLTSRGRGVPTAFSPILVPLTVT